jgi:hypothetical protein
MKNLKIFIFLNIILIISSCGTIKEGFTNQKKNNSDEFLVEKKSPLIMPPNFNELPVPKQKDSATQSESDEIKTLISKKKNTEITNDMNQKDKSFEETILKKIKNN